MDLVRARESRSYYFSSLEEFPGSWNVAPGQTLPITRLTREGAVEQVTARWGLVPFWSKEEKIGYKCINARAETVCINARLPRPLQIETAMPRAACGFYEWIEASFRQAPYYITSIDESLLAFAGLWDVWKKPDGDALTTFTIHHHDGKRAHAPAS
jgi:putative SOS response-associated peptidase YedK